MTNPREALRPSVAYGNLSSRRRRTGAIALVALASFVCCAASGPESCQTTRIGPSPGEIVGIAAGVGAAVVVTVVLVNNAHHSVKGCVFNGQNGLEVQTQNDMKTYALVGATGGIKVGDLVQFHGAKVKKVKNGAGDQTFAVEKISRDYGPCSLKPGAAANAGSSR